MKDNPGFVIEFKTTSGRHYRRLTFGSMKKYIECQPESELRLQEFAAVQSIAKIKGSSYPIVKKWFLDTYPAFKETTTDEEIMEWIEQETTAIEQNGAKKNNTITTVNVA